VEAPEHGNEKPANTESSVREGKRPGLVPDSGYGPSLRAEELDTPRQRLTYSEVSDRPCGRRDETEVRYTTTTTTTTTDTAYCYYVVVVVNDLIIVNKATCCSFTCSSFNISCRRHL